MRILWTVALIIMGSSAYSQSFQDVIYKKDGSILKGLLIEQNFESKRYKIQLAGGSIFVVKGEDIDRIDKEQLPSPTHNPVYQSEPNYQPTNEFNPVASTEHYYPNTFQKKPITNTEHVFYIGTLSHSVSRPVASNLNLEFNYSGIKLAAQKTYSKNIAAHYALNTGSLSSVEYIDDDYNVIQSFRDFESQNYLGLSAAVIVSTNLQYGWQFFTGGGINHNKYTSNSFDRSQTGLSLELGMGYAWRSAQVILHYQGYLADDYPNDIDVNGISLQLGLDRKSVV